MTGPGTLDWQAWSRDLVADPVATALGSWDRADACRTAPIDADLADTAAYCEQYAELPGAEVIDGLAG